MQISFFDVDYKPNWLTLSISQYYRKITIPYELINKENIPVCLIKSSKYGEAFYVDLQYINKN